eukprot:UN22358
MLMNKQKIAGISALGAVGLGIGLYYYFYCTNTKNVEESDDEYSEQLSIREKLPIVDTSSDLYKWLEKIPKVELHAHLHGSIRDSTLLELMGRSATKKEKDILTKHGHRNIKECWKVFDIVHRVIISKEALHRITVEMIEDFNAENTKYLEIRTTPRAMPKAGLDMEGYVTTVLGAIKECDVRPDLSIRVNLILSVNRAKKKEQGWQALELATKYKKQGVVGIDFSGRPTNGFSVYIDIFNEAKIRGIKTSVHCAEWMEDTDTDSILKYKPDRVGHF